jgi:hypothetical protein
MSYDSLVGLDHLETSEAPRTGQTISMFQDTYRYARAQGMSHVEAQQHATDYHRRYTQREVTQHWSETGGNYAEEDVVPVDELLSYNQLVARLWEASDETQRRFLMATIRLEGLDAKLDAPNRARCEETCGVFYPVMVRDIAEWMGLRVRENGSCTTIAKYRQRMQETTVAIMKAGRRAAVA